MSVTRTRSVVPGAPLIELRHVARRFVKRLDRGRSFQELFIRLLRRRAANADEFWPLRDLSLTVHAGDCVGIIGHNGSGKSTLLKLITGILPPTQGEVVVRGRVSSLLELGAGFQPDLTGRENIYLNGSIYGLNRREIDARLASIIEYAGLGDFIDTPIKHYSSGMYVRLGFAVAIHTDPDLLLVDEVLAVGDSAFQTKCMNSIHDFRRRGGTLLLVTHDLNTIQSLCTRAVWIDKGLIAAEGAPIDVIAAYKKYWADLEEQATGQPVYTAVGEGQRWGTGEVEITAVALCDSDGTPRRSFVTGQPLTIQLHYRCSSPVQRPVFGLAINHQTGFHIYGPNTQFGALPLDAIQGSGVVSYTIDELPLLEGQYVLSVAAHNESDTVMYDYHDRAYTFSVAYSPARAGYGMVRLPGTWSHQPTAPVRLAPPVPTADHAQPAPQP